MGGIILTLGFGCEDPAVPAIGRLVAKAAAAPRVCGAHLAVTDAEASGVRTAETTGRADITNPPGGVILVEGMDAAALAALLPSPALIAAGAREPFRRGLYRLEYVRGKTAFA
jgi:hypothetical protein